jgi:hypothetical protein
MTAWLEWLSAHAHWAVAVSVAGVGASLALLPTALARIPADYFCHGHRQRLLAQTRHPLVAGALAVAKNLLGGALVAAGLLMLFIPGQGLITLLAGLIIANYPGKFALERWLIERPHVLPAVNRLRARFGHAPLLHPDECKDR